MELTKQQVERHVKFDQYPIKDGCFQANDSRGAEMLIGMKSIEERWVYSRKLFNEFIKQFNCEHWHIVDGWIRHKNECGYDQPEKGEYKLTWIHSHAGYSHTYKLPKVGDRIIIIDDSPDVNPLQEHRLNFKMKIMEVVNYSYGLSDYLELKLLEIKNARFNKKLHKYELTYTVLEKLKRALEKNI